MIEFGAQCTKTSVDCIVADQSRKFFGIESCSHNFASALFDFADVNQHSCYWIDRPGKNKIGDVIAAAPIARTRFGAESAQIFSIAPIANVQTASRRELEALANG